MKRVSRYTAVRPLLLSSSLLMVSLLMACDAFLLCGEYACVTYQDECKETRNCTTPRQCESAGSIRDRAPRIVSQLRETQRACGGASALATDTTGIRNVVWDETLAGISVSHARDMSRHRIESFVGSNGQSTAERVSLAGIESSTVFESILAGPQTSAEAINIWLDINTDCQQLFTPDITRMGMACSVSDVDDSVPYWSLLLAGPEP